MKGKEAPVIATLVRENPVMGDRKLTVAPAHSDPLRRPMSVGGAERRLGPLVGRGRQSPENTVQLSETRTWGGVENGGPVNLTVPVSRAGTDNLPPGLRV